MGSELGDKLDLQGMDGRLSQQTEQRGRYETYLGLNVHLCRGSNLCFRLKRGFDNTFFTAKPHRRNENNGRFPATIHSIRV